MLRLRILGHAELIGPDGAPLRNISNQPKLLALLAYLLARRGGSPRRDTLLGLFWPQLDSHTARHALSQSLSVIRSEVGPEVLDGKYRDRIQLNGTAIWCDAVEFRTAVDAGRYEGALALYDGPLLDGFYITQSPEFERWLDEERHALQQLAVHAAVQLARAAIQEAVWEVGRRWAERAIELQPYEESGWQLLMQCLDGAGDRAAAVSAFHRMTQLLHHDLEVSPSPETLRLVERVRGRSTLVAPLREDTTRTVVASAPEQHAPALETRRRRSVLTRRIALATSLVLVLFVAALAVVARRPPTRMALDPNVVAILPFEVSGPDSLLNGLEDGMVELLAVRLGAERGVRAVDPRATLVAWKQATRNGEASVSFDSNLAIAERFGAGRVLLGSVIAAPGRVALNARLYNTADRERRGHASVAGPPDSLLVLVDRLSAQVLGLAAGEDEQRIRTFTTTSLPALRAYLNGRAAYRSGNYLEALKAYERALDLDSTFALAGMGVMAAVSWVGDQYARGTGHRADVKTWANRDRLSERDRLRLLSFLGFRRPGVTPAAEHISFVERALTSMPDDPEMWYELGEQLLHQGPQIGLKDWRGRAHAAFQRSVELDSTFLAPLLHLVHLSADSRDTAALRRHAMDYLARAPEGNEATLVRWLVTQLLDEGGARREGRNPGDFDNVALSRVVTYSSSLGVGLDDAEQALGLLRSRAASAAERARVANRSLTFALLRGRPRAARAAWLNALSSEEDDWFYRRALRGAIFAMLYADGDSAAAREAARELATLADSAVSSEFRRRSMQFPDICAVELWRLMRGSTATTSRAIDKLRSAENTTDPVWHVREATVCAAVLEILLAEARNAVIANETLVRFDALLAAQPLVKEFGPPPILDIGNLTAARLWEKRGSVPAALTALQRRRHTIDAVSTPPAFLRAECRIAIAARQRGLAAQSCERFLALRSNPEPSLQADTERIRAAYASLVATAQ